MFPRQSATDEGSGRICIDTLASWKTLLQFKKNRCGSRLSMSDTCQGARPLGPAQTHKTALQRHGRPKLSLDKMCAIAARSKNACIYAPKTVDIFSRDAECVFADSESLLSSCSVCELPKSMCVFFCIKVSSIVTARSKLKSKRT